MRRLGGLILAIQMAAGLLLPLTALGSSRGAETMACCMMHGRCDCGHSDASFARCTGQDSLHVSAVPPAVPAAALGRLAADPSGRLLEARDAHAAGLFDSVPPTPPPRSG